MGKNYNGELKPIVAIGGLVADLIIRVENVNHIPDRVVTSDFLICPGGGVGSVAITISRLGHPVRVVGWACQDAIGLGILRQLDVENSIDLSGVFSIKEIATSIGVLLIGGEGAIKTLILSPGYSQITLPEGFSFNVPDNSLVYLNGYTCMELDRRSFNNLLKRIEDSRSLLLFDPQSVVSILDIGILERILCDCFTLSLNQDEAKILLTRTGFDDLVSLMQKFNIKISFLRKGALGCEVYHNSEQFYIPAKKVNVANPVAAGDCFNGAVIVGLSENLCLKKIAELATDAATYSVTKLATGSSAPTRTELNTFISSPS